MLKLIGGLLLIFLSYSMFRAQGGSKAIFVIVMGLGLAFMFFNAMVNAIMREAENKKKEEEKED